MDYVASAVMRKDVVTVPPTLTLAELEAALIQHRVSGFAVVDDKDLVGVVSHSDVIGALSPEDSTERQQTTVDEGEVPTQTTPRSEATGDRAATLTVKDVMTANVVTVGPEDSLHDVADLMYERRIHRIFVVDGKKLMGIITPFDFVRLYSTDRIGAERPPDRTRDF